MKWAMFLLKLILVRRCLKLQCHLKEKFCWNRLYKAVLKGYVQENINQVHFLYKLSNDY